MPNKQKNSKYEYLNEGFVEILDFIEHFALDCVDIILNQIKITIRSSILKISSENLLRGKDDDIFDYCKAVNSMYSKFLNVYNKQIFKVKSNNKIKILEGIKAVVLLQISLFGENLEYNPIKYEKKLLLDAYLEKFDEKISSLLDKYKKTLNTNNTYLKDLIKSLSENSVYGFYDIIFEDMRKNLFKEIYSFYCTTATECENSINDLNHRKTTTKYLELLKQEKEVLFGIITNQVSPLEEDIIKNINNEEKLAIQDILRILREAHQYIGKKVCVFSEFLKNTDKINKFEIKNISIFEKNIYKNCAIDFSQHSNLAKLKENFDIKFKGFIFELKKAVYNIYNKKIINEHKKARRHLEIFIKNKIKFADEIANIFKILRFYYDGKKTKLEKLEYYKIIQAIDQTIQIKIEILKENISLYKETSSLKIKNLKSIKLKINDLEMENAFKTILLQWIDLWSFEDSNINKIFVTSYTAINFEKNIQNLIEEIYKISNEFVCESILREIITFEEINIYSVSKLKSSSEDYTLDYVDVFNKLLYFIKNILSKNEIDLISPNIGSVFNPKEQEILMVEKNDKFSKGQIIKVVNSGYKKNDVVLIRANIIACK